MRRRRKHNRITHILLILLIACGLAIAPFPSSVIPRTAVSATEEIRGVWITNVSSSVLFFPWEINRALDRLSALNFNTVYPVVWNRGTTFFRSAVARRVTGRSQDTLLHFTRLGRDILSEIVREGHDRGLRVIPWLEYGFMAPINSQLVKNHPDWVTQTRDSNLMLADYPDAEDSPSSTPPPSRRRFWLFNRIHNIWLNPLHPGVQRFMEDLILEVVMKYDVDGIQLDDHFGIPVEFGYDRYTIELYKREHGGKSPPDDPQNPEWRRWRSNKITDFIEHLVKAIKTAKPDCIISLSPNPYEFTYNVYLQDWLTWVNRGWMDELVLQVYRDRLDGFIDELEHPSLKTAREKVPVGIGILSGTLTHPVPIEQIKSQVKEVRDRDFDGVSFFYWETLWSYLTPDAPEQRRQVFQQLFSETQIGSRPPHPKSS
ncbi:MAG: glycoside hydrolase family 10 protein [Limnospira sp.]